LVSRQQIDAPALSAFPPGAPRREARNDGWYTLDLVRQPGITPDMVSVTIEVPPGWRIVDGHWVKSTGSGRATTQLVLDHTTRVRVRLAPATDNIWQRLLDGQ